MIYLAIFLIFYVLPLALTALVALVLYKLVFRGRRWGIAISIGLALALSCVQPALDRVMLRRELARYTPDEISPKRLALAPGPLLHLQEANHAGVTCDAECDFDALPFVTESTDIDLRDGGAPGSLNLWDMLPAADRAQPFPYRYAFVSISTTSYAEILGFADEYRKPYWPEIGISKGAHMLVDIPESGMLDLARAPAHFRRFNLQADLAMAPFWGFARHTTIFPEVGEIFADLSGVAAQ